MGRGTHRLYIGTMAVLLAGITLYLAFRGHGYYSTALEERFYHGDHAQWKPSGLVGHGLGIAGSLSMILGVSVYMLRKRLRALSRMGLLRHWLEFHIFLCLLGPVLVAFHTTFKVGGIVALSFWSMVTVALSGVAGRFIYVRIPRTIEGREMSLGEIRDMKADMHKLLSTAFGLQGESLQAIVQVTGQLSRRRSGMGIVRKVLRKQGVSPSMRRKILALVRRELSLNRRIERLQLMQKLFRYWHVAHLPFALIMLVIMLVHVAAAIVFGYTWVF